MTLPQFEYVEPKSLRHTCRVLSEQKGQALVIAGGTDLLQALKNHLKSPRAIVDLKGIPRLRQISFSTKTGLKLGALVTLRELSLNALVAENYPLLTQVVRQIGTPQLQAMGTVGGNLCQDTMCLYYNRPLMTRQMFAPCYKLGGRACLAVSGSTDCWAVYCGDLAPVLLALGARVKLVRATRSRSNSSSRPASAARSQKFDRSSDPLQEKVISLQRFFSRDGLRPNVLRPGEILTEIFLPPPAPRSGFAYLKLRMRQTIDYPLLGVAVNLSLEKGNGTCKDAIVALTGVDQAPLLILEARKLKGKQIGDVEIAQVARAAHKQARPLGNVSELTPKYRREMIDVYVRRAFQQALEQAS